MPIWNKPTTLNCFMRGTTPVGVYGNPYYGQPQYAQPQYGQPRAYIYRDSYDEPSQPRPRSLFPF